jgi:serine/threonine-protein kinase
MLLPEVGKDQGAVARFLNEGRAAARLENAHVARVSDVGVTDRGMPFLVMELLEGMDLARVHELHAPLPVATVVDYLMEAMEALAEAHSLGIVHRDLKPANLFLARRKDGDTIKVLDFGIAKAAGDARNPVTGITATNALLGSPAYMAPEQLLNARGIDARADLWSLGVVAYELLTGTLPFEATNVVALYAAIRETVPRRLSELRSDAAPGLEAAIHACLQAVPTDRFPSVTELGEQLAPHGSPAAAVSLQRIRAILPGPVAPRRSEVDLVPGRPPALEPRERFTSHPGAARSSTSGAVTTGGGAMPMAQTADAVIRPGAIGGGARRSVGVFVASAVALGALAVGAVAFVMLRAASPSSATPRTTAPVNATQEPASTQEPTASPPQAPLPEPLPPPTTTAAPSASAAATPSATGRATHPPRERSPRPPDCDPPFVIDGAGRRIPKPECL